MNGREPLLTGQTRPYLENTYEHSSNARWHRYPLPGADALLRRSQSGGRPAPGSALRLDLRFRGPQWGRKDHHHPYADRAGAPHTRDGLGGGGGDYRRRQPGPAHVRLPAADARFLHLDDAGRIPGLLRPPVRAFSAGDQNPPGRDARAGRAGAGRPAAHRRLFGRDAAAPGHRPGPAARPAGADPGRADQRPRPGRAL